MHKKREVGKTEKIKTEELHIYIKQVMVKQDRSNLACIVNVAEVA